MELDKRAVDHAHQVASKEIMPLDNIPIWAVMADAMPPGKAGALLLQYLEAGIKSYLATKATTPQEE